MNSTAFHRPRTQTALPASQRGIALVMVLWMSVLLAVLVASFSIAARTETLMARNMLDTITARYAAEAGLHYAVFQLRMPDPNQRWVGDGRSYEFDFEGTQVNVEVIDESGKIDVNAADQLALVTLFTGAGRAPDEAETLAARVIDWRDPDDLLTEPGGAEKDDYESAGLSYGCRDLHFFIAQIQQGGLYRLQRAAHIGLDHDIEGHLSGD